MLWVTTLPGIIGGLVFSAGGVLLFISREWAIKALLLGGCLLLITVVMANGNLFGLIAGLFDIPATVL